MKEKNELLFTDFQQKVIAGIRKDGEFLVDAIFLEEHKEDLKDLMWRELIKRKKSNGITPNVFVKGWAFPFLQKLINQ